MSLPKMSCRISFLLTITVACLAGAREGAGQIPAPPVPAGSMSATRTANVSSGETAREAKVKIGPGDELDVNVLDEPDLEQTVQLDDLGDGTLNFIGSVHLAGLAIDQAEALIARKLTEGNYLLSPHVSVVIQEYSTQGVSVLGEVKNPGVFPVLGGQSLLDVSLRLEEQHHWQAPKSLSSASATDPHLTSFYRKTRTNRFRPTCGFTPGTRSLFRAPVWCTCWERLAGQAGL